MLSLTRRLYTKYQCTYQNAALQHRVLWCFLTLLLNVTLPNTIRYNGNEDMYVPIGYQTINLKEFLDLQRKLSKRSAQIVVCGFADKWCTNSKSTNTRSQNLIKHETYLEFTFTKNLLTSLFNHLLVVINPLTEKIKCMSLSNLALNRICSNV